MRELFYLIYFSASVGISLINVGISLGKGKNGAALISFVCSMISGVCLILAI